MKLLLCALVWLACAAAAVHPHGRSRSAVDPPAQDTKVVRARGKQDEPSCEELKAMWRFSKRQARAPEIMNDLPSYRDPFTYNEWPAYQATQVQLAPRFRDVYNDRANFVGPYGRVVHKAPAGPQRVVANYDDRVSDIYGVLSTGARPPLSVLRYSGRGRSPAAQVPQQGSFQHLKDLIRSERARELQAQRAAEQLAARAAVLKDLAAGGRRDDGQRALEHESHRLQDIDIPANDDPQPRRQRPIAGRQYGRYSDLVDVPERRAEGPQTLNNPDEYPADPADPAYPAADPVDPADLMNGYD